MKKVVMYLGWDFDFGAHWHWHEEQDDKNWEPYYVEIPEDFHKAESKDNRTRYFRGDSNIGYDLTISNNTSIGCPMLVGGSPIEVVKLKVIGPASEESQDYGSEEKQSEVQVARNSIEIKMNVVLTDEDIDDIMVSALEGRGIVYWCGRAEVVGEYLGEYASEQISRGGTLLLHDREAGKAHTLSKSMFLEGMRKYIQFGNTACLVRMVDESHAYTGELGVDPGMIDGEAADSIIQYAIFGEIIYD